MKMVVTGIDTDALGKLRLLMNDVIGMSGTLSVMVRTLPMRISEMYG